MRNGLVAGLMIAGAIWASGSAYAQSTPDTTKVKPVEAPKVEYQRKNSVWDKNLDVGIGFQSHCLFYAGFRGVNEVEDTTATPHEYNASYGIGARVLFGKPNPNSGGLTSLGLVGVVEKDILVGDKRIPIRILAGGAFYNPEDPEATLEMQPIGIIETGFKVNKYRVIVSLGTQDSKVTALAGLSLF